MAKAVLDFRFLDEGMGGQNKKKRRRDDDEGASDHAADETAGGPEATGMVLEDPSAGDDETDRQANKRQAVAMEDDESRPRVGRLSHDGAFAGRVSGRTWKLQKSKRTSALRVTGRKEVSLEEKNRQREMRKAYRERKEELKEQIRANKQAKRQQVAERRRKKEENDLKGAVLQRITNPNTLKRMSKKQRQSLVKV